MEEEKEENTMTEDEKNVGGNEGKEKRIGENMAKNLFSHGQ